MWKLVIEDDEGKRTVVPLTRDDYTIGRKEGNTIRLTERNVSRAHAKIRKATNGVVPGGEDDPHKPSYVLEDLTSYNGVYVNGIRVAQTQELTHGDLIQIGDYRIVLQDDAVVEAPVAVVPDPKTTIPSGGQRASTLMERPNRLVMLAGPTPGAEYPLDRERMTIGRAEDASISVNHNSVSRLHCEVHALGEGRFEIVDKGSSNGVRVNSADLRRGIVEAGDVIELGDVKFKFVGAGQIFLPGVNDSQQLAAIGDRDASAMAGGRRGVGVLPYVVFGAVVAAVAVGAWAFTRPRPEPIGITPLVSPPQDPAQATLEEARKLCDTGDCETAHEKIANEIPSSSPLRDSADYKSIESRWADALMQRAESEPDVSKKRSLLDRVSRAPTVDAQRRKTAADRLQLLDGAATNPNQLPIAVRDAGATPERERERERPDAGPTSRRQSSGGGDSSTSTTSPTPKPTSTTPAGSDIERERALMLQGPSGATAARALLEPKVFGNRATGEEIRMLKAICKDQHDQICVEKCKALLSQ
jgi:pSer/pThr/pTyr-binding forkhead associated (FHA) protein